MIMKDENYDVKAKNLSQAIDIAIYAFTNYPPRNFSKDNTATALKAYIDFKYSISNPEEQYKNIQSIRFVENDVFTYFQEATGETVNRFWQILKERGLPYHRENKLKKIIKRGKIANHMEYDFILDVLVSYKQEGVVSYDEAIKIEDMLANYERKK
jgi:predicted HTH domain antitoxin